SVLPPGGLAEQVHSAVVAKELQLAVALVEDDALERPATRKRHATSTRSGTRARTQRPQERHKVRGLGPRKRGKGRHSRTGHALANHGFELLIVAQGYACDDRRPQFAAGSLGPVAIGTTAGKNAP